MKKLVIIACFSLIAAATLLLPGCETDSVSKNDLTITPSSIGLHNGDSTVFTASGGFDYTWSLQNPSWGALSDLTGPTTRYTDRYDPGSNGNASAVQTLTVTSTIQGANSSPNEGSSSNATSATTNALSTATAQIEHLPTSSGTNTVLSITPSSATLHNSSSQTFTASGGSGDNLWMLNDTTYGDLSANNGSSVTYTRTKVVATNFNDSIILYVFDSSNNYAQASLNIIY